MSKIFIKVTLCVFFIYNVSCSSYDEDDSIEAQHPELARLIKMRCTRRFSPGVCVEDVAPVWTFVFFAQNCTERLGCPNHYRTNRFRSYRMCMKRCRPLIDIYLQMVEFEERNNTKNFENQESDGSEGEESEAGEDTHLRIGVSRNLTLSNETKNNILLSAESITEDPEDEDYEEDEKTHAVVYKDVSGNEDIMLPDVDYVSGEIRSEFAVGEIRPAEDVVGW
ncbi:uncharacterized protein LOC113498277 [Trichoplusia ni]|uniref:Uncharacterized protein LOC113498277 n=1 Tax=Trichoplusia ni TaxID=7111 RepID=A0A7E5W087_TRINI|nr:uncharacterized protein LOC113498277 [Trichoplusia ni]